jgi:hypothetical protein
MGISPFYFGIMREKLRGPGRHSSKTMPHGIKPDGGLPSDTVFSKLPVQKFTTGMSDPFHGAWRPLGENERVEDESLIHRIDGKPYVLYRIVGPMSTGIASDELWKKLKS